MHKGLSPVEFASRVWSGIGENRFWILPQPDFKSMYQLRVDSVMNETDPLSLVDIVASGA